MQGFSGSAFGLEGNDDFQRKLKVFSFAFSFVCLFFARASGSRALTSIRMIRMVSPLCFWL